jgi:hypothetical protein
MSSTNLMLMLGTNTPELEYLSSLTVGSKSANQSFSHTLDIGAPHPNRRIIIYNTNDYNNPSSLNQTCSINGVTATRVGSLPEGFTGGGGFTGRPSGWLSQIISEGTTASLDFNCNASNYWSIIGFSRVTNVITPTLNFSNLSTNTVTYTLAAGESVIILGRAFSGEGSATSVTNATLRFSDSTSGSQRPYTAFDHINNTGQSTSVTFTADGGRLGTFRVR